MYVAATTNAHYELTMQCLEHDVPVLAKRRCAETVRRRRGIFRYAREHGIFVMEGMWYRFSAEDGKGKGMAQQLRENRKGESCYLRHRFSGSERFHKPVL